MRKISLVAAIALMLAGVGVWATSTTQARIDVPAGAQINPLQIMMGARHLPAAHYDDYSWCSIERPACWRVKPEHGNSSRGCRSC
jgi:hypothetical protein